MVCESCEFLSAWCLYLSKPHRELIKAAGVPAAGLFAIVILVILLSAIGGMITSGIVGLFVGAIVLALGYKLFGVWINWGQPVSEELQQDE